MEAAYGMRADAVEIDARYDMRPNELTPTALRHMKRLLEDFGMKVCSVAFQTRRGYHVAEDLDSRVAATKQAMEMAYKLGAPVVVNRISPLPPDDQTAEWELLGSVLHDLAEHANRVGAWLALRTGWETPELTEKVLKLVPSGGMYLSLDPGELVIHRLKPAEMIQRVGGEILHVYARDGVRDASAGKGFETALGRGSVDFPAILGQLEERDYKGPLVVERMEAGDPLAEVEQGVRFLRSFE